MLTTALEACQFAADALTIYEGNQNPCCIHTARERLLAALQEAAPQSLPRFPRFTVLVVNTASKFMAVAYFDVPVYATDFAQRGNLADWQIWENLPDCSRFINRKVEWESRLCNQFPNNQPFAR